MRVIETLKKKPFESLSIYQRFISKGDKYLAQKEWFMLIHLTVINIGPKK